MWKQPFQSLCTLHETFKITMGVEAVPFVQWVHIYEALYMSESK